jgi:hypothetical protein
MFSSAILSWSYLMHKIALSLYTEDTPDYKQTCRQNILPNGNAILVNQQIFHQKELMMRSGK